MNHNQSLNEWGWLGIKPAGHDKDGPMFLATDVAHLIAAEINNKPTKYFKGILEMHINPDFESAEKMVTDITTSFVNAENKMLQRVESLKTTTKLASGNVRKAADDLMGGMAKIEKQANFNNLEKYVVLLERAAQAMTILAELEKNGKLDKIVSAIK